MGVALPVASSLAAHNSLPVRESKARSFESLVAPTKTSPPAVAMVPPTFGVPVFSSPCGASSSKFPSGTFHTISPVVALVAEPLDILGRGDGRERRRSALELMETVGLPAAYAGRRPLELSGGQRQRLAIARALAVRPQLLILDEAFAGLDAPIQAQVASLLRELQGRQGLTYLYISHDLALMSLLADEVAIMFEGRIVEHGAVGRIFADPCHPHTRALIAAMPTLPVAARPPAP